MNRREFLVRTSLTAAGLLTARGLRAAAAGAPPADSAFGQCKRLRGDVGTFVGRGGTIGWLAGAEGLAVVDTQFPDTAALCLAALPGRAGRPLDVVLNTHHHADHTSGNPTFKPAARMIVAQANVPRLQFEAAKRAEAARERETAPKAPSGPRLDEQVYADTTFPEVWRREVGREVISAQYFGPAHTSGDAVVYFEKANVLHVGDLVFNRMYPVIDRPAGASVRGWIKALEDVAKAYPADVITIFGHGHSKFGITGGRADLFVMRDYWTAVLEHVQKQIAAGQSRDEIVRLENLPGFPDFHSPLPNRLGSNLAAAYDELTEKKA